MRAHPVWALGPGSKRSAFGWLLRGLLLALSVAVVRAQVPVITAQPVSAALNLSNLGSFSVTATSGTTLSYQWRKDSVAISGATGSTHVIGAVTVASAGTYEVVVANAAGSVVSSPAILTINPAISFFSQPSSLSVYVGQGVTFSAGLNVTAGTGLTYQWRKNGVAVSGATGAGYALAAVTVMDAGNYDLFVTNSAGSATSNPATLAVSDSIPLLLVQPVAATLAVGGSVTLSVTASGTSPLTYQWRRDGFSVPGATGAALVFTNVQTYQNGDYTVDVTNARGSVTSIAARVNIVPRVVAYSARLMVDPDGACAVFSIEGSVNKKVLLRAVGPGLAPFGISAMADPQLELFNSSGNLIARNNDWGESAEALNVSTTTAAVGAFALAVGSTDSAMVRTLTPGSYTVRVTPASGGGGTGYLELYDADLATGPMSTVPYVAVRGRLADNRAVVIGGLGSNGRGQRSYLLRAIGPALGVTGVLANPALLAVRDGTLVGNNDDWDANAAEGVITATATARIAAFALPAGGRDAATVLTGNLHAGTCTVQVGGDDPIGGLLLLELHDLDAARPTSFAPVIASGPTRTTVIEGQSASLRALANGTAPLAYQWRKDGTPIAGATSGVYTLAFAQASQGGSYTVAVTNAVGNTVSVPATLVVQSGGGTVAATHAFAGAGYAPGGTVTITNTITYSTAPTALGWSVRLPAGWSFVSDAGSTGEVKPMVGASGTLDWAWFNPPASPAIFTYTVTVPAGTTGDQAIAASAVVRFSGNSLEPVATPGPLLVPQFTTHGADTNSDFRINLFELTRVIELYNTRNGTTRTGCYAVATSATEDGFVMDSARVITALVSLTRYHSADTNRDGKVSLFELTRVIELYNTRSGTTRTGQYHVQGGTEDGFAAGP